MGPLSQGLQAPSRSDGLDYFKPLSLALREQVGKSLVELLPALRLAKSGTKVDRGKWQRGCRFCFLKVTYKLSHSPVMTL